MGIPPPCFKHKVHIMQAPPYQSPLPAWATTSLLASDYLLRPLASGMYSGRMDAPIRLDNDDFFIIKDISILSVSCDYLKVTVSYGYPGQAPS